MSSNSSKRLVTAMRLAVWSVWVIIGFGVAQVTVGLIWSTFSSLTGYTTSLENNTVAILCLAALAYVVALVFVVGTPRLLREETSSLRTQLGMKHRIKGVHITYAFAAYGVYFVATILFALFVQAIWQDFPLHEAQQTGFGNLVSPGDYLAAFIALVIIPPVAEELLFRGYLFGKLRRMSDFWLSAIITSLMFGVVHWQWNVGIDVFVLSLVLCYLREKTGTVWAGIILHMIKNSVAFTLLFLQPQLMQVALKMFFPQ